MKTKISLSDFSFRLVNYGRYVVTYTYTSKKQISAHITDMTYIDLTKNCDEPKVKDLKALKELIKYKNLI